MPTFEALSAVETIEYGIVALQRSEGEDELTLDPRFRVLSLDLDARDEELGSAVRELLHSSPADGPVITFEDD